MSSESKQIIFNPTYDSSLELSHKNSLKGIISKKVKRNLVPLRFRNKSLERPLFECINNSNIKVYTGRNSVLRKIVNYRTNSKSPINSSVRDPIKLSIDIEDDEVFLYAIIGFYEINKGKIR